MLTFACVTFSAEISFLQLQARSIAKFVDPKIIDQIILIVNEDDPAECTRRIQLEVLPEYGDLAQRVAIVPVGGIVTTTQKASGWRRQQTAKLMIARFVKGAVYVALDCKNVFIRPVGLEAFITPDGKLITTAVKSHGDRQARLDLMCAYFSTKPDPSRLMPITTPFAMLAEEVVAMMETIERREDAPFDEWFHAAGVNYTEFFLYYAWLCAKNRLSRYHFGKPFNRILWEGTPTGDALVKAMNQLASPDFMTLSLHRKRARILSPDERSLIADVYRGAGLFSTQESAVEFVASL